jgi:hypothetical protein
LHQLRLDNGLLVERNPSRQNGGRLNRPSF